MSRNRLAVAKRLFGGRQQIIGHLSALTTLDMSHFETKNVENMSQVFILQVDGIFHSVADGNTAMQLEAYSAYLDLSFLGDDGSKLYRMVFDGDEPTGVDGIYDQADQQPKVSNKSTPC